MIKNIFTALVLFLFVASISYAVTSLTNCTNISSSGDYILTSNAQDGNLTVTAADSPHGGAGLACFVIAASNVNFDCDGFNINKTVSNNTYAIFINHTRSNITISNCNITNYNFGIYGYNLSASSFSMNDISYTGTDSIALINGSTTNITSNTIIINNGFGLYNINSTNLKISSNVINSTVGVGGPYYSDSLTSSSVLNNFGIAFGIFPTFYFLNSSRNTISGNTGTETPGGDMDNGIFYFQNSSNNTMTSNFAYNGSTAAGFYLDNSPNNTISGNTATNDSKGIRLISGSHLNVISSNTITLAIDCGIDIATSNNTMISSNTVTYCGSDEDLDAICLNSANSSTVSSNTLTNNGRYGIDILRSSQVSISSNSISSNSDGGMKFDSSQGTTNSNTISSNNGLGVWIYLSNVSMTSDSLTSHTQDLLIDQNSSLNLTNVDFVSGKTVLSLSETGSSSSSYSITGTTVPTTLPAGLTSFASKALNITNISGSPTIESATWHWSDWEVGTYDENSFVLYKYNGTWTNLNADRYTTLNTLNISNLAGFSVFSILRTDNGNGNPNNPKKLKLTLDWNIMCGKNTATINGFNGDQVNVRIMDFTLGKVIKDTVADGANNKVDFDLSENNRANKIRFSTSGSNKYEDLEVEKSFNVACNVKPKLKINIVSADCKQTTLSVVDLTGNLIANADVKVQITGKPDQNVKTDAKGQFQVFVKDDTYCGKTVTMQASAVGYDNSDVATKVVDCNACNLNNKLKINIVSADCKQTTLSVVDKDGKPVPNADVSVKISTKADQNVKTDANGRFSVGVPDESYCSKDVNMQASALGYDKSDIASKTIDCNACKPMACVEDGNCQAGFKCVNKMCVKAPDPCKTNADCKGGQSCNPMGICQDTKCTDNRDCVNGGRCNGGICKQDVQCTKSADCASSEICSGGVCSKPQVACGEVKNHVIITYECGEGCQPCAANYVCSPTTRKCIFGNITGPKSGFNGDPVSFYSWVGNNITPCVNCLVEVKDPSGKLTSYTTNAKGNIALIPNAKGQYNLTLLIDSIRLSNTTYVSQPKGNFVDDLLRIDPLVCLALLILAIILAVLFYQRTRNNGS